MTATLYDYRRSTASFRVRIALHLARIPFESIPVDLLAGEQRAEAHLIRNPQGFVPVLDIDGRRLTQSLAIVEYLDETRGLGLVPGAAHGRARVRAIAHVIAMDIHPVCNPSVVSEAIRLAGESEPARTQWMRHFIGLGLSAVETLLDSSETGRFCHGETPSLADLCLVPQLYNANRWGVAIDDLYRITKIAAACAEHPAFAAASPDRADA